jgi:uncharacterized protein YkwD
MRKIASASFALCCALFAMPALASIADGVNQIRRSGCNDKAGVKEPLRVNRDLDAVAREWSKGGRLRDALPRTDYRGTHSESMRVEGSNNEKDILAVLRANYCDTITDASFKDIGVFQRGDAVWIVVATPFTTPSIRDAQEVSQKVLALVNEARGKPRKCGRASFKAAPPLTLSALLSRAALIHNQDMSSQNFFEHQGSDGSKVGDRVARVGYRWGAVAENIAIGAATPEAVVNGWLDSPGHCSNIMDTRYTEMGIAYLVNRKSDAGIYWTQVFARPL